MNILQEIVATKREEIKKLPKGMVTADVLKKALKNRGGRRDFLQALITPLAGSVGLIAEVKKASPSAGLICPDFDPVRVARHYEMAGASCLSVLTDEKYFQGSLDYLRQIRSSVKLPLLRKDFIIDERQILEAVQSGADAILLIVAILDQPMLEHLLKLCREAHMDAVVEVHDVAELKRAVAAKAEIIGVNNRNLKTFKVDLATMELMAAQLAKEAYFPKLLVAESGIHTREDVVRLEAAGANAILVGESLMKNPNIPNKVRELLGIV